jgi:hypothetical protein
MMLSVRHVCHEMVMHRHGITTHIHITTTGLYIRVLRPRHGPLPGPGLLWSPPGRLEVSHQFSPHTRDTPLRLEYVVFRCRVMTPEVS